jgi:REP element-mobilizing transposase RayT
MFVSTTILGFVPVFKVERVADTTAAAIVSDSDHEGATLDAFVVMPEHVHLLVQVPAHLTGSQLMDRLKSAWANRLLDVATDRDLASLDRAKESLRSRTVWQRSFRGLVVEGEKMWRQKVEYIHSNPVRRGLCERPEEYPWSSARLWEDGCWNEALAVDADCITGYWPSAVLDPLVVVTRRVVATRRREAR